MPLRLSPAEIARHLLVISPDRDERASQLCAETLLTLFTANDYTAPREGKLRSPKKRQFALRSLVVGTNFLDRYEENRIGTGQQTPSSYGRCLAVAQDFSGSENIGLANHGASEGSSTLRPNADSLGHGFSILFPKVCFGMTRDRLKVAPGMFEKFI